MPALSDVHSVAFHFLVALSFPASRKIHNLMKKYLLRRTHVAREEAVLPTYQFYLLYRTLKRNFK